jgi:hypothetical protein
VSVVIGIGASFSPPVASTGLCKIERKSDTETFSCINGPFGFRGQRLSSSQQHFLISVEDVHNRADMKARKRKKWGGDHAMFGDHGTLVLKKLLSPNQALAYRNASILRVDGGPVWRRVQKNFQPKSARTRAAKPP